MRTKLARCRGRARAIALALAFAVSGATSGAPESPAWRFKRGDTKGILLATLHALPPLDDEDRAYAWRYRRWLRNVMAETTDIYLERQQEGPKQKNADERTVPLEPALSQRIQSRLPGLKGKRSTALLERPDWEIALALGSARQSRIAAQAALGGTELEILRLAEEAGLSHRGLEAASRLYEAFAGLPAGAQRLLLEDSLADDAVYADGLRGLALAFREADHGALCERLSRGQRDRPDYWEAIVVQRNRAWLETIERLPGSRHYLIAVGTAHTCGEDSLLGLLRQAGFTIDTLRGPR